MSELSYRYPGAERQVIAIKDFQLKREEKLFLYGPSGSGKTTLLGLVTGILRPQQGQLQVLGTDFVRLSNRGRDRFRGSHIGYIFQMFNLIPYLSVLENITLPCQLSPQRRARLNGGSPSDKAIELAEVLGLAHVLNAPASKLSVGQQQRVAAARALIGDPELIIADEPTSSLDADVQNTFLSELFTAASAAKSSILFVSHDQSLRERFDRSVSLSDINVPEVGENR